MTTLADIKSLMVNVYADAAVDNAEAIKLSRAMKAAMTAFERAHYINLVTGPGYPPREQTVFNAVDQILYAFVTELQKP